MLRRRATIRSVLLADGALPIQLIALASVHLAQASSPQAQDLGR